MREIKLRRFVFLGAILANGGRLFNHFSPNDGPGFKRSSLGFIRGNANRTRQTPSMMKFKLGCFLLILAHSYLGLSSMEASEETDAWGSFSKIDPDIRMIMPEKAGHPALRQKITRTLAAYEKFRSLIKHESEWSSANLIAGYSSQLNRDQQMLHSIVLHDQSFSGGKDTDGLDDELDDGLDAALDDLYLKVNACLINGGKAVGSVSVTVHTKKSGVDVPNLRVMCMAKILRLYRNYSPTAFPQLSSPTKWQIAPGNYLMWTEDPETGEKSPMQEIPIDRDQECDLAVQ